MNRAYYAALLRLRERIEEEHGPSAFEGRPVHAALLHALQRQDRGECEGMYQKFLLLQIGRNEADYKPNRPDFIETEVRTQIRRSENLILNRINVLSSLALRRLEIPREG